MSRYMIMMATKTAFDMLRESVETTTEITEISYHLCLIYNFDFKSINWII